MVVNFVLRLAATAAFVSSTATFAWIVAHDAGPMIGTAAASSDAPATEDGERTGVTVGMAQARPDEDTGRPPLDMTPVEMPEHAWSPPAWLSNTDVLSVAAMDQNGPRTGGPSVRSRAVFIYDADADTVLFERRADEVRPVASITKLVSALAVASSGADLDREICIGIEQYPTRNGATSRLSTGDCLTGWDIVGAALVASDNRAAMAMAALAGEDLDTFVAAMDGVSAELDMHASSWSDPSGLEDENLSTARDIAKATLAVSTHPVLSTISSAPYWDIPRSTRGDVRRLNSTDHLVGRQDIEILAAKTGFTNTARYCFTTVVRTRQGHRVVVTLLGAESKGGRWADMATILSWLNDREA